MSSVTLLLLTLVGTMSLHVAHAASKLALVPQKFDHWIIEPLTAAGYEVHVDSETAEMVAGYALVWHGLMELPGVDDGALECAAYPVRDKLFVHLIMSTALNQHLPETCPLADGQWFPKTYPIWSWRDAFDFKEKVTREGSGSDWILKLPNFDKGAGIEFMTPEKWMMFNNRFVNEPFPWIVQRVVPNILLTRGKVFEMRKLVFVSSYDPLVVYRLPKFFVKRGRTGFDPTRSETREVHITSMSSEERKTYLGAEETSALPPGNYLDAWELEMSEEHGVNMSDLMKLWQTHAESVTLFILSHLPRLKRGGSLVSTDFLPTDDMELQFLEMNLFSGCLQSCKGAVGEGIIAIQLETFRRQREGIAELGLGADFTGPDMQLIHDDSQDPPFSLLDAGCRVDHETMMSALNPKWWHKIQKLG